MRSAATDAATAFAGLSSDVLLTRTMVRAAPGSDRVHHLGVQHFRLTGLLEGHRLVTVTGPGGMGKTRLAAEVARRVADRFPDGVWFIELGAVADVAQVPAEVTWADPCFRRTWSAGERTCGPRRVSLPSVDHVAR
jgi:hypothetical protein